MNVALLWALAAFLLLAVGGSQGIRMLRHYRIGKKIRFDGPASHQAKMGTPTMGGIMIIGVVLLVSMVSGLWASTSVALSLATMCGFGLLGAYDDWLGLGDSKGVGLLARAKFPAQLALGIVAAWCTRGFVDLGVLSAPAALFLVVGAANGVNITDGLDGLAGGTCAIAFAAYAVIARAQGQQDLASLSLVIFGALLGFLWHNVHPAAVFMGDVGSMALGSALAMIALQSGQWVALSVVGLVFVIETLSVALQVLYFKASRGKRLFRMAPLHHHLELTGWPEVQITQRLWIVSACAAVLVLAFTL